jgi:molecular chaperone GrpE (heat shock protein)
MATDGANLTQLLLAGGLGGLVIEAFRAVVQRKKMGADYAEVISQSAINLLNPLERRIKELESELAATQQELADCRAESEQWREEAMREREKFHKAREGNDAP